MIGESGGSMALSLMLMLVALFVVAVIYCAKAAVLEFEHAADRDVLKVKGAYLNIIQRKDALAAEKQQLRDEADRIFEMYELTREVTATFDEKEAFAAFKAHVSRRLTLEDCRLVDDVPLDVDDPATFEAYRFFPLRAKQMVLGEVAYKGLAESDEEAFSVFAHQLALAFRRIRLYNEVESLAITDSLTRMNTRRHLAERFDEEFSRAQSRALPLSLLMIDVDHFKNINDQHGHLAGDAALREIARVIAYHIREIDIAGRYGGEEFCVILPDTDKQGALVVAERIRAAIAEEKVRAYDTVLNVTVSVGVATFPEDALQMDELLDKSDWALYRAKKSGRDRVVGFSIYTDRAGA